MSVTAHLRLEPRQHERNLADGFAAGLHDPVWFLARQWQMGEHQGENATSPIWVDYRLRQRRVSSPDPRFDPTDVPAEAIVESEVDDWWTMGRRVRIGRRFAATVTRADLLLRRPAPPYEAFEGAPDGLAVWLARAELGIADDAFGEVVPPDSTPCWDPERLLYDQDETTSFDAEGQPLTVRRHHGGHLDWHSVDAGPAAGAGGQPAGEVEEREAIPTPLGFPGAPNDRWWQIEDAEVDLGGFGPDSAHTATAVLTELLLSHSGDWFLLPVLAKAGHVVAVEDVVVRDCFDRTYADTAYAGLQPPSGWSLFANDPLVPGDGGGLAAEELVLWHVAELPLESAPVERVQLGRDEQSNVLWAVERTVDGRDVDQREVDGLDAEAAGFNDGPPQGDTRAAREYAYVPARGIGPWWTPYTMSEPGTPRRLVQTRLADLSLLHPVAMPAPVAAVLQPPAGAEKHVLAPLAVPSNGIEITRRWSLARDMHGEPVLWRQRQRGPLLAPPARTLRYDVMEPARVAPPG